MQLFKKLQKKDAVTKVKALKAISEYVQNLNKERDDFEIEQILTFFLYHFCRIVIHENERQVREQVHVLLGSFLDLCKKKFASHIKKLFPLWYISFFDTSVEV